MRATKTMPAEWHITESGCWILAGRVDRNGYCKGYDPSAPKGNRVDWAHRIAWREAHGPIPPRHEVDHLCQQTRCINPSHLEVVTRTEHIRRTLQRLGKDDLHGQAAMLRVNGASYAEIAEALGYASRASAASALRSAMRKGLVDPDAVPSANFLTDEDRADIRLLRSMGAPQGEIASWYGIHDATVSRICNGKTSRGDLGVSA